MSVQQPDMPPVRADGLQLAEDRRVQERIWTAERVSHVVLLLIVLAALAGVSGSGGLLSRTTLVSESGTIDAPRILRWDTAEDLTLRFADAAPSHRLRLEGPIPHGLFIESIQPQPSESRAAPNGITYDFTAEDEARAAVTLRLRAGGPGLVSLGIALDDAPSVATTVIVLP